MESMVQHDPKLLKNKPIIFDDSVTQAKIHYLVPDGEEYCGTYSTVDGDDYWNYHHKTIPSEKPIKEDPDKAAQLPIKINETNNINTTVPKRPNNSEPKGKKPKKPRTILSGVTKIHPSNDVQNIVEANNNFTEETFSPMLPAALNYNHRKPKNCKFGFNLV